MKINLDELDKKINKELLEYANLSNFLMNDKLILEEKWINRLNELYEEIKEDVRIWNINIRWDGGENEKIKRFSKWIYSKRA